MSAEVARRFGCAARFALDGRGGTAVEFALTLPILAALLFATLQVGVIFIAKAYLETGAEQAARTVMTNNATVTSGGVTTPMTQAQFQAAVCSRMPALFNCANLIVQLQLLPPTATSVTSLLPQFKADGTLKNATTYTTGSSGALMVLTVMYQWPVFGGVLGLNWGNLGNGTLLMTSTQIFRKES